MKGKKKIELRTVTLVIENNNFLTCYYKNNVEIEKEDAIEVCQKSFEALEGNPFVNLVVVTGTLNDFTNEAMEYFGSYTNLLEKEVAQALVLDKLAHRILANIFTKLRNTNTPIKVFSKEEEAKEWLEEMLKEYTNKNV